MPQILPAKSGPLGAAFDGEGVRFALFSEHAERVDLCLFDSADQDVESHRLTLPTRENHIFSGYVPGLRPGQLYGYRVDGPFAPSEGHRFNQNKLLFDPYAKAVGRRHSWSDALFGYPAEDLQMRAAPDLAAFDTKDSAPFAPLAMVVDRDAYDWRGDRRLETPIEDTVVYETHVRGLTQLHPGVPAELCGTYQALGSEPAIEHLLKLGVTAVELLPIHYFLDEPHLTRRGLSNYWGYNTLGFFAPQPDYAAAKDPVGVLDEFRDMVRALHGAGLEVWLDVVYNHTSEGNERGPTLTFRGIDNLAYYRLPNDDHSRYMNYTGTGNSVDLRHPQVLRLVLDSLRYWVEEMHIDGFRFDLCSVLGRETNDFDRGAGFFDACAQDPVLSTAKLVAEPWDLGIGGYRVGGYPTGWSEWNGKYRDDMRRAWKGDTEGFAKFATRLAGSSDLYDHSGRAPTASVNFITAHDGFTMADLVAYERKRNMANGEFNRDGEAHNNNWNHGVEGPTDDPAILEARRRSQRNMLATLLLSNGVPMISHGDEVGRTQRGNNNAYCQDNDISWIDWELDDERRELLAFVQRMTEIRREHPQLRRRRFLTGEGEPLADVTWLGESGRPLTGDEWGRPERRTLAVLFGPEEDTPGLLLLFNTSDREANFLLPDVGAGASWTRLFDTRLPEALTPSPWTEASFALTERACAGLRLETGSA